MPSTVFVTREQFAVLADEDADVTLLELPHAQGEVEAWIDKDGEPARSIIVDEDGGIVSDMVLEDIM